MTLLLTRSDVTALLDLDRALELITTGFRSPTSHIAGPRASSIGFVGAGAQAQMTWAGLRHLRPWTTVVSTDTDPARSIGDPLPTAAAVAAAADVVVLATWSRQPILDAGRPGQHFTTLGADEPGKVELSRRLLETSRVIVDDPALVAAAGALGNVGLDASATAGTHTDGVSVYAPIGLPWQDLALSWALYRSAVDTGAGLRVDLPA